MRHRNASTRRVQGHGTRWVDDDAASNRVGRWSEIDVGVMTVRLAVNQAIDLLIFGFGGCNAKGRGHQISNGNFFGDIQFSFFGGAT